MTQVTKRKLVSLICALLVLSLFLCGCDIKKDVETQKKFATEMLDMVMADDIIGGYSLVGDVGTKEEFLLLWTEIRNSLKDTESYELKAVGWNTNINNGIKLVQVSFEVTTNDGRTCYLTVTTFGDGSLAGLHFRDSTTFIESTSYIPIVNIALTVVSLVLMAFTVWMFIDAVKRRIKYKPLWAILTLVHMGFDLAFSSSQFDFNFEFRLAIGMSSISAHSSTMAIALSLFLPVGAVVYFFVRKKLTLTPDENANTPEATQDNMPDTAVTLTANSETDAAEQQEATKSEVQENNDNTNTTQQGE